MKEFIKKIFAIILVLCIMLNICISTTYAYIGNETEEQNSTNNIGQSSNSEDEQENKNQVKENTIETQANEAKTQADEYDRTENNEKVVESNSQKNSNKIEQVQLNEEQQADVSTSLVSYRTHVQNIGWQAWKKDGETSGTSGQGLRLEAININLNNISNVKVKYQVHIQNIGWQSWKSDGELAGTSGQSLRLEAIRIKLDSSNDYTIKYRVHIQNIGWQGWKEEGELAGTSGQSLRLEAIEIKIVEKTPKTKLYLDTPNNIVVNSPRNMQVTGWKMSNLVGIEIQAFLDSGVESIDKKHITNKKREDVISKITGYGTEEQNPLPGFDINIPTEDLTEGQHTVKISVVLDSTVIEEQTLIFYVTKKLSVEYSSHIQNIGWQDYVDNGNTSGAEGKGLRLEALKINLYNSNIEGTVQYSTHVQDIGWQNFVENNELAGTTGKGKRIEAIKIRLTGELAEQYDVYYRTYVQGYGWLAWTENGENAGTQGLSFRLEALQIKLVEKGTTVDTSGKAFITKPKLSYKTHVQNIGWQGYLNDGDITGTVGKGLRLEALKLKISDTDLSGTIQCSSHVQYIGWMNYVNADQLCGTEGASLRLEGVRIKLTGELAEYFDVYYRTHVQELGWIAWAKNGEACGTQGYEYRLEALQITLVPKGAAAPGNTIGHFFNKNLERKSIEGIKLTLGNVTAGIDISEHQGNINWDAVKSQTDFVIIRCGYGQNYIEQDDQTFETNIKACIANNIPIEVYLYSYADTPQKASSEADHVMRLCNEYKGHIQKIWYDVEDNSVFNQISAGTLSKNTLGAIVDTFANKLRTAGYSVGLYTYSYSLATYFPESTKNSYDIWIANYPGTSQDLFEARYNLFKTIYKMWQFTSEGVINGISGNVDLNIRF